MRSALLCVCFALAAIRCRGITIPAGSFRPTPIPLKWHRFVEAESRPGRALDAPAAPVALPLAVRVPPHYWEDALRHSVYLTLVRDNIDALVARGELASPDRPDTPPPQDLGDKDLWDKIKSAPFERVPADEKPSFDDVTLVSSGKMLETDGRYHFSENDRDAPGCDGCADDAKAIWSVKRMRHREHDAPGRHRYELTFSVITDPEKSVRRPHENPIRTFTVKESSPEKISDEPHENKAARKQRGERALWVHKNIFEQDEWAPHHEIEARHGASDPHRDTERMFTSLFMEDEKPRAYYPRYEHDDAQRKYVNVRGPPQYPKQKKPLIDHQQKKLTPYPYKPHGPQKYARPPLAPISQAPHHYLDIEQIGVVSSPYVPSPHDHRHIQHIPPKQRHPPPGQLQLQPQPSPQQQPSRQNYTEQLSLNENVTKMPPKPLEPIVVTTKNRPSSIRIGYVTEHVRPPVYNTPPGVFVTMDKKPFKPLPPMKLHHAPKLSRPADFRPSPQVLDIQFSEPDPLSETFRPINVNYTRPNENSTESQVGESTKNVEKVVESENTTEAVSTTSAAPPRRTSRITTTTSTTTTTTTTTTTPAPEPSTSAYEDIETMSWANLLGAFTGSTPSDVPKTTTKKIESETEALFETSAYPSTPSEEEAQITSTSTTIKPTRPTYKPKVVKVKKHKRVFNTTTKAPKVSVEERPSTEPTVIPLSTTEAIQRTTAPALRQLHTLAPTTTPAQEQDQKIEEPHKPKNRYRLSTLMTKGTSVKHDKWSTAALQTEPKPVVVKAPPVLGKYLSRRTESNFHGYLPSSTTESGNVDIANEESNDRIVHITSAAPRAISSTESLVQKPIRFDSTKTVVEQTEGASSDTDTQASDLSEKTYHKQKLRTKEKLENLYRPRPSNIFSLKTNDRMNTDETTTTTQKTIVASPHTKSKNGTKCKKKQGKKPVAEKTTEKASIQTTTEAMNVEPSILTTPEVVTPDIFEEFFGIGTENEKPTSAPEPEKYEDENENEQDSKQQDIYEDFFGTASENVKPIDVDETDTRDDRKQRDSLDHDFDYSESAPDDVLNDPEDATTTSSNLKHEESGYEDFSEPPYSLFELMAME